MVMVVLLQQGIISLENNHSWRYAARHFPEILQEELNSSEYITVDHLLQAYAKVNKGLQEELKTKSAR